MRQEDDSKQDAFRAELLQARQEIRWPILSLGLL